MKVALTVAVDDTRIEERPDPVCGPGDVVCRVLACATCGSDVGWYVEHKLPAVLGHEPVGEVVAVGAEVVGVAVGDRVAIHHHAPCGECRRCRHGHETLCEQFRATALDPGAFAEYVRIQPELVGELLPLDGVDPVVATLTEPLGCALRAQDRAGIRPGDSLLVVGAGCSGMLQIAAAHARGVDAVWVREPDPQRLAAAEDWGATAHGNEPVDVAIVCTEHPQAIADAAQALAPGGSLCLYAPPEPGSPLQVEAWAVFARELRVTASWSAGPADMRASLALLGSGQTRVAELIGTRFPLAETGAALAAQRDGEVYKAVVEPVRAALLFGDEDLRVLDVPDPLPRPGEVLVRIEAATTCGTDVKSWQRGHPLLTAYPAAFGHEMAGVREDTGERVLVGDSVACGTCRHCQAGRPQICSDPRWLFGGFAELMAAPEDALHAVPDGLEPAAAAMAEPLAAAVHAIARAPGRPIAPDVGVLGGGPMGQMLAALLVAEGRTVTLADRHAERRAQAEAAGAMTRERLADHDVVFEAVGRPDAWREAVQACARGGCVVFVGGCKGGTDAALPTHPLHYDELDLRGAFHHSREEVDRALALLAEGAVDWRALAAGPIGLDDLAQALGSGNAGPARKWVVIPGPA